jgi:hypothetical protein
MNTTHIPSQTNSTQTANAQAQSYAQYAGPYAEYVGQTFGELTITGYLEHRYTGKRKRPYMTCTCACGKEHVSELGNLRYGSVTSCGHHRLTQSVTHGKRWTPEYTAWGNMMNRCRNKDHPDFFRYGGRGITVCERWNSFEAFLADMGERPGPRYSIDRIDNDGNYTPGNVRWATPREQANNRRNNVRFTVQGKTLTQAQWCRLCGIPRSTASNRLKRGIPPEVVFAH